MFEDSCIHCIYFREVEDWSDEDGCVVTTYECFRTNPEKQFASYPERESCEHFEED